jgi:hypothetical protein
VPTIQATAAGTFEVRGGGCDGSGSPRAPASTGVTVTKVVPAFSSS